MARAPKGYGPHKRVYNRLFRWSRVGVFNRISAELAGKAGEPGRIMIDAAHLKATAPLPTSESKGGEEPRSACRFPIPESQFRPV